MSQALRKLTGAINKSKAIVIFVNQVREKIGVMFGNPETTPGGRALKFYSSVRIDIRKVDMIKSGVDITGIKTKVKIVKNKVAPPFKFTELEIEFGKGISREGDLLDLAVHQGLIEKSGTWFSIGEERMGQGREAAKTFLRNNPQIFTDLEKKIQAAIKASKDSEKNKEKEKSKKIGRAHV